MSLSNASATARRNATSFLFSRLFLSGKDTHRSLSPEHLLSSGRHVIRLEAKVPLELFERRRGPERLHADDSPRCADVTFPSKGRRLLYGDARGHLGWQHAVPVLLSLVIEDVPGRHRDYPRADTLSSELLVVFHGENDFAARGDENHFGIRAGRFGEHEGPPRPSRCRGVFVPFRGRKGLGR